MELVGAAASVSQLISYSYSVSNLIAQLITDTQAGPVVHRHKVADIRLLDILIKDILETPRRFSSTQEEVLIPIIIQISATICKIQNLLNQPRSSRLIAILTISARRSELCEEFNTLESKRQFLSLYLVQDTSRQVSMPYKTQYQYYQDGQGSDRAQHNMGLSGSTHHVSIQATPGMARSQTLSSVFDRSSSKVRTVRSLWATTVMAIRVLPPTKPSVVNLIHQGASTKREIGQSSTQVTMIGEQVRRYTARRRQEGHPRMSNRTPMKEHLNAIAVPTKLW